METTANGWIIVDREAGVLVHEYEFAPGSTANTFVARMPNGQLLAVSPGYRMSDGAFADLAEFGQVGAVVASNGFHHLGLPEWHARYPEARFFAHRDSMGRIKKRNASAPELEALEGLSELLDDSVSVTAAPATKCGETWARAKTAGGHAWFVSDILANVQEVTGPLPVKLLMKFTNSAPGYKVFNLALKFMVKDKKQVLRQLSDEMKSHPPTVIVPAHGPALDQAGIADETQSLIASAL